GGAGTTGTAFAAGVPQFIIPHFAEQPYWGRRSHELGVGVKPVPKQRLSDTDLARGMTQMATDQRLKAKAAQLGELIRGEDGINRAVHLINDIIAKA
ncbi:MAG: glycosyltransferase, partial [Anaerolineae bacterium]|nr:glycosyltransferase [Anaerolineae bacterium]